MITARFGPRWGFRVPSPAAIPVDHLFESECELVAVILGLFSAQLRARSTGILGWPSSAVVKAGLSRLPSVRERLGELLKHKVCRDLARKSTSIVHALLKVKVLASRSYERGSALDGEIQCANTPSDLGSRARERSSTVTRYTTRSGPVSYTHLTLPTKRIV